MFKTISSRATARTRAVLVVAALTAAVGTVPLVQAAPAQADPVVGCGSTSTYISSGDYFNLRYKNCGSFTQRRKPYDEFYGYLQTCKSVAPGSWVSWTRLPSPAWHSDWVARAC